MCRGPPGKEGSQCAHAQEWKRSDKANPPQKEVPPHSLTLALHCLLHRWQQPHQKGRQLCCLQLQTSQWIVLWQQEVAMETAAKTVSKLAADAEQADLVELLREAPREAYSFQNAGWPSDVVGMKKEELPGVVLERYNTRQSVCFCGVLPEISRAWASVDNALFLWRLDVADDVPVEYSGEEQAIVAVGLVKPKSGVFLEAISYVLVIATTVNAVRTSSLLAPSAARTNSRLAIYHENSVDAAAGLQPIDPVAGLPACYAGAFRAARTAFLDARRGMSTGVSRATTCTCSTRG